MKTRTHERASRTRRLAFTLIELLIVVAIIAILTAIAVPNFLEAQTRAKVSRVKSDMRSVATAMESYMVDNNKYPIPADENGGWVEDVAAEDAVEVFEGRVPVLLTTPIAYMTSRPLDPFAVDRVGESRLYHAFILDYAMVRARAGHTEEMEEFQEFVHEATEIAEGNSPIRYILDSFGPDKDHDIGFEDHDHEEGEVFVSLSDEEDGDDHDDHGHEHGHDPFAVYDPTNGTISSGDIFYMAPGIGFTF